MIPFASLDQQHDLLFFVWIGGSFGYRMIVLQHGVPAGKDALRVVLVVHV
jgi:hypothetical protein